VSVPKSSFISSRIRDALATIHQHTLELIVHGASLEAVLDALCEGIDALDPDLISSVLLADTDGRHLWPKAGRRVPVELGHTDTDYTTCLNVPSIGLVVAGDAAYNDVHLYLAESNAQTRQEWIAALDKIESLNPRAVVASHKRPENDDNPGIIEQTRQYIRDFDRLAATTTSAQDLYKKMLELYPNRVNPGWALWSSARAVKPLNPEVVA
jgi:hypothetical protein